VSDPDPSWLFEDDFLSQKPGDNLDLKGNIWTHQKSTLISRYLHSFLAVTRNGIYLDAFAGPQDIENREETWAAKKVLEKESIFLRRACLFEMDQQKIPYLEELRKKYCQGWARYASRRQVVVAQGDSNETVAEYLRRSPIKPKRAAFALLDQRTHECAWSLVKALATHKSGGNRIELFYFLAQGWMDRSMKSAKTPEKFAEIETWWGRPDWRSFLSLSSWERAEVMQQRFKDEFGYKFTKAFPMRDQLEGGRVMFWLIHASDHPRAIPLMGAAYRGIYRNWTDEQWERANFQPYLAAFDPGGDG
jgi:three-Cys-motif partner protein